MNLHPIHEGAFDFLKHDDAKEEEHVGHGGGDAEGDHAAEVDGRPSVGSFAKPLKMIVNMAVVRMG